MRKGRQSWRGGFLVFAYLLNEVGDPEPVCFCRLKTDDGLDFTAVLCKWSRVEVRQDKIIVAFFCNLLEVKVCVV